MDLRGVPDQFRQQGAGAATDRAREEDERVPAKQSRMMMEELTKAGGNVTSVFCKKRGHSFSSSKDFADWLRRLEAFLAKHNPA